MSRPDRAVVAIGGNSLITDPARVSVEHQLAAARETDHHIGALVAEGLDVTVVHGNGPQVGFILLRSELARHQLHEVPLDVCVADTQGAIGYLLQQSLVEDLRDRGVDRGVVSVVTQVEVDPDDPAFRAPTKPIGPFMGEAEAAERREQDGWDVVEDANRGWRRVVASPRPRRIVEIDAIRHLIDGGFVVISVGGGGIPVVLDDAGHLQGVPAVIDKDHAGALLAREIGASRMIISTSVEKVAVDFGTPDQQWVDHLTLAEARTLLAEGRHFAAGSMAPKIEAIIDFLDAGGDEAIITTPQQLEAAVAGHAGTRITR
ncbi:MAG TPA: carbamate kinase [Egicoccus sp.]|nr:carbamate kinase [Egicoccus sp.]HSK22176.1 carbamate kinase [Egicoccus sp.]